MDFSKFCSKQTHKAGTPTPMEGCADRNQDYPGESRTDMETPCSKIEGLQSEIVWIEGGSPKKG